MQILEIGDKFYPRRLLKINNKPKKIYVIGNVDLLNSERTLGIVGTRDSTLYGEKISYNFAKEISKNRICIVSGLAKGIDGQAHNGAICEIGKTIAVLGCSINDIYPKENEWLFHKILTNGGCIISEYGPNVEINMNNFPKRNRIISRFIRWIISCRSKKKKRKQYYSKICKRTE